MKKNKGISQNELVSLQLENVVKYAPGFFYCKDRNSVYKWCNDEFAQLAGLENREQVIGKTDFELAWKERAQLYVDVDKQVMKTGIPTLNHEEIITISNNRTITAVTNKVPIFDKRNRVVGLLGITTDITHQKKIEEELRLAKEKAEAGERTKTEFIANVTHDIRTPLTGIIGVSEYLKETMEKEEDRKNVDIILSGGRQLLHLLNDVLDNLSEDKEEENQAIHKPFDIYALINDVCALEKPAILAHHLDLHLSMDNEIPRYLIGDKIKLHRILLNLIGNGIKFTKKGSITLTLKLLEKKGDQVRVKISVTDTGIGIPPESQAQVFDRFYKVSSSYKGKFKGNGIGLHIVQKYTKLLGGEISLHSKPGEGTTFSLILTLPMGEPIENNQDEDYKVLLEEEKQLIDSSLTVALKKNKKTQFHEANQRPQILVIEDNAGALHALKLMLSRFDVEVQEAIDAEIAFELIKNKRFDLIITDIGLPGISGDELGVLVRQYEKEKGIARQKIVALTGHAVEGEFGRKCLEAGIDKVYRKPMETTDLKKLIEPLVSNGKANENSKLEEKKVLKTIGKLGFDLPDTEEELFEIDVYPIVDLSIGTRILGSEDLTREILKELKPSCIDGDLELIKEAYSKGDWGIVEKLTHKIKGASDYGTVRLHYALLYTERYLKAGHKRHAEELYKQMLRVINETCDYIEKNL